MPSFIKTLFVCLVITVISTATALAAFTVDIHPGEEHLQVKELQILLNQKGFTVATTGDGSKGLETTVMGPATVAALKRFQAANKIAPTGIVGPQTRVALNRLAATVVPTVTSTSITPPVNTYAPAPITKATTTPINNTKATVPVVVNKALAFVTIDLYPGQENAQVKTLQQLLNSSGYTVALTGDGSKGLETTIMGPATVAALKRFQAASGITQTGITGPLTRIALLKKQLSNLMASRTGGITTTALKPVATSPTSTITATKTTATTTKKRSGGGGGGGGSSSSGGGSSATPVAPVATFSLSSSSVSSGASVTLTWSSTNATACTGTNFTTGSVAAGSVVVNPTTSTTYTLTCTGTGGNDIETGAVTVAAATPAPVATFTASPTSVTSGSSVTLTWSTTNASSCTGTNFSTGSATSGTVTVNPTTSTTYMLTCTGAGGSDVESRTVTVSGVSSNISLSAVASRTSGVAPLAVFFDATDTTDTDTTRPFSDLEYRWNFGDASSGTWGFGARPGVNSRNTATGGVAAHVFETPGTYTVTLDATGESGTESTELTITVTNPDTVFAGTATRCISRVGNFTGCPSGAAQVTTTDMAVVETNITTGRRILFKRGETWGAAINMDGVNGPGILGSYGTGALPVFTNLYTGGSGVSDWRMMDLEFARPIGGDLTTAAIDVAHPSSRFTFLRVKATGAGTGADGTFLSFAMNIYDTPSSVNQHVEHAIVDSEITDGRYAFYGAGDKIAFMGNYLYSSGENQHVYRSFYANKGVNSNNTFAGGGDAQGWGPISLVKQHAPDQPGAYSEYLHWSDNRFAPTNVYVSLGFGSENEITDQRLRHVVVERNWFSAEHNAQLSVNMASGYDYTVRNNLFVMDNYWGTGVQVQHTSTGPVTDQAEIFNNTFYKSDGGGDGMDAIQVMDLATNVVVRNNLAYAPNATNPVMVSLLGGTTITQSNNSTDTQMRTVSPSFLSATPTTLAHFDLLAGSYARNAGYAVPVYADLLDRLRPQGASFDLGAIEGQ